MCYRHDLPDLPETWPNSKLAVVLSSAASGAQQMQGQLETFLESVLLVKTYNAMLLLLMCAHFVQLCATAKTTTWCAAALCSSPHTKATTVLCIKHVADWISDACNQQYHCNLSQRWHWLLQAMAAGPWNTTNTSPGAFWGSHGTHATYTALWAVLALLCFVPPLPSSRTWGTYAVSASAQGTPSCRQLYGKS